MENAYLKKMESAPSYTPNDQEIIQRELEHIGATEDDKRTGLAISGGGIRSAAFGMGVLQGLADNKILSTIDYLSTVSGGGYIGSSLTWFLQQGLPNGQDASTEGEGFPFGRKFTRGKRIDPDAFQGNEILNFIRQHGNYLTPGKGLNVMSLLGVLIRSTFVSLLVYSSVLYLVMSGLYHAGLFDAEWELIGIRPGINPICVIGLGIGVLMLVLAVIFALATLFSPSYQHLVRAQSNSGRGWTVAVSLILLGLVAPAAEFLKGWYPELISGSSISLGAFIGLYEQFKSAGEGGTRSSMFGNMRILIGAFALLYGLLLMSYLATLATSSDPWWWLAGALAVALVIGFRVNLNVFGFHRMYRDRLMETFMPNARNVRNNEWGPATDADSKKTGLLELMCQKNRRPYHIINTNLVTVSSDHAKYSGRGGENFIMSPLYCGSDATGWVSTHVYRKKGCGDSGIRLGTAMAISGAAVNPSAGPNGRGVTKSRIVSVLLGLLNVQLGFWSDNPNARYKSWFRFPTFLRPGIYSHFLGKALSEKSSAVLLTDGGHFENLGLYELVRRKLNLIIVSDAGADPKVSFEDLANALEKVRVDFGTRIQFLEEYNLEGLIPGSIKGTQADKFELASRGHAVARITYHDGSTGTLVLIKTTLTDGLPADIYGYKSNNPTYPDQSTGDQFFDEAQFEAYRELGYQLTKAAVRSEVWREKTGSPARS